jgi:hypothetical protein
MCAQRVYACMQGAEKETNAFSTINKINIHTQQQHELLPTSLHRNHCAQFEMSPRTNYRAAQSREVHRGTAHVVPLFVLQLVLPLAAHIAMRIMLDRTREASDVRLCIFPPAGRKCIERPVKDT